MSASRSPCSPLTVPPVLGPINRCIRERLVNHLHDLVNDEGEEDDAEKEEGETVKEGEVEEGVEDLRHNAGLWGERGYLRSKGGNGDG